MSADLTPKDIAALRDAVKCRCGHPRSDHAVKRPYACTEYAERVSWYCPCNKFQAVERGWDRLLDRIESDAQRIAELQAKLDALGEPTIEYRGWLKGMWWWLTSRPMASFAPYDKFQECTVYRSEWRPVAPDERGE